MKTKQLSALFLCNLIYWTIGNGLLPLLPVYAIHLGANPAQVGYYLASSYLALAVGTLAAGWISDTVQRRKETLAVSIAIVIPAIWAVGHVNRVWQLEVLTAAVWFLGGMGLTLLAIIAGLFSSQAERGRVFGILAAASALGSLLGGLTLGAIADRWGYSTLFLVLASFAILLLPLDGFVVEDRVVAPMAKGRSAAGGQHFVVGFFLLLAASTTAGIALFAGLLGRSLAMKQLGFSAAAISSTVAVSGAVTLPLAPLIGSVSDRVGRRQLMVLGYAMGSLGAWMFSVSLMLWQFWTATTLLAFMTTASNSAGPAFVADLVPPQSLGRGISMYNATTWVGAIFGFVATGHIVQTLGAHAAFIVGAFLPLLSIAVLFGIRQMRREPKYGRRVV